MKSKVFKTLKQLMKYITVSVFIFLLANSVSAQTKSENFFFVQLSDPQFGMFDKNVGFEKETALFEKAVSEINRLQPDLVIITGDFVHNENSEKQINEFKRLLAKIDSKIPVYLTPGNHDVGKIPDTQSLKMYKQNYGKDRFSFTHKKVQFVGFNTSLIKGKLEKQEQKQFRWLQKQLKKGNKARQTLLFCHYPFFNKNIDEANAYATIDVEYRKKYLDLFAENSVTAVFTGHHHNNLLNSYKQVELITTSAAGKPLGKAPSGMRIIKVYEKNIEHKYFGFDVLPDNLESF